MEYKRFTERVGKGIAVKQTSKNDNKSIFNAIEHLAELEDKIEQGTLIELPCKVGDTVYIVYTFSGIDEWEVTRIDIMKKNILFRLGHKGTNDYNSALSSEMEETLFFNREEAEKRLKELQNA